MQEGTILLGKNGMGKTSILRLALLFFGSSPSEITRKDGANKSFIDYNLPTDSSYLIFEYMKEGQPLMVIAHRQASSSNVAYRFADGEFDQSVFYSEDSGRKLIIENVNLAKTLTSKGISHSSQYGHSDYKEILQSGIRIAGSSKDSRKTNETKAKYSFCQYNKTISGTEKVGQSTLENKASFDGIKSLIANGVMGMGSQDIASPPRFSFEEMNKGRQILSEARRFLKNSDLVREMGEFKSLFDSENAELSRLKAKSYAAFKFHQSAVELLSKKAEAKATELNDLRQEFEGEDSAHQTEINGLNFRIEGLSQELDAITAKETEYDSTNIESKKVLAGRVAELEAELKSISDELKALTHGYTRVTDEHAEKTAGVIENSQTELDGLASTKNSRSEDSELKASLVRDEQLIALDEFNDEKLLESSIIQAEDAEAGKQLALLKIAFKNPESDGIERARTRIETLSQEEISLNTSHQKAKDRFFELKENNGKSALKKNELIDERGNIRAILKARNDDMDSLLAQKDASKDTVFHQVKEHSPTMLGIALKTLTREALLSTAPGLVFRDSNSPLSFDLDCSKLVTQDFYDEDELKRRIGQAGAEIERLAGEEARLTSQIDELLTILADNKKTLPSLEATVNVEFKKLQQKQFDLKSAGKALDVELEEKKHHIEGLMSAEESKEEIARSKLEKFQADKEIQKTELLSRYALKIQSEVDSKVKIIKQYEANVEEAKQRRQTKLQEIQTSLEADLTDAGVQKEELERISGLKTSAEDYLEKARQANEEVKEYQAWSRDVLSKKPGIEARLKQGSDKLKLAIKSHTALKESYASRKKELQRIFDDLESKLNKSEKERLGFENLNSNELSEIPFSDDFSIDGTPPLADEVKHSYQSLKANKDKYFRDGRRCHLKLSTALRDMTSLSHEMRELLAQEGIVDIDDSSRWHESVYAFALIMNNFLQQEIDIVKEKFARIGVDFITIHEELEATHENINKKGREISNMMNEIAPSFDNLLSIEAKIESNVNNKNQIPYRDKLRSVATMAEDIKNHPAGNEPGDDYYSLVSSLLREMQSAPQIKNYGDLIDITIKLDQEGQDKINIAKTDKELESISSVGLSYLLLLTVYVAITKTFKSDTAARVVWPIDELGKLHSENVRVLKDILDKEGIVMFSATPETTPNMLCIFKNLYEVDKHRNLKRFPTPKSALEAMDDAISEVSHVE